ncbi:NAD(P)/FAD-dependent oxidoreductase [Pararhodospirillum oryzae]|uniref:Oxidoreductase n=1 Tax=Pararhodospirillum oryzae TaxID=478448 RepID=A0A512H9D7_9PROT|nr:FAD-binding oxidoreductase [Pararhodospirillum oryzae]GEO82061.1 oxidoreductase [Pararhodospirillum oryzae]
MFAPAPVPHAPSWYAASAHQAPPRPPVQGHVETDICVIGAGFTGLSAALDLAEKGYRVRVVEAARVGWGASGRNGGQIVNGYSRDLAVIRARYGVDAERALAAMAQEGGDIIRERVHRHAIACDLVDGGFHAAFTPKQMRALEAMKRDWEGHGLDGLEMVDRAGLDRIVHSPRYVGGMLDHKGGHFHPLNYCLGLARAFEAAGGTVHEGSAVIAIEETKAQGVRIECAAGTVSARLVLVCANAYLKGVLPALERAVMPVNSQVVTTAPLPEPTVQALLPANACVEDCNYVLDYYRRTADNRILYGGGIHYGGGDPLDITRALRSHLETTFPSLAGVRLDYAWSGTFALTLTRIPHIGRLGPSVWFSHGDSGHGVTTTQLLGRLLAEAADGQMGRFDVFAALPNLPFPGGRLFRVPLTRFGAWYYSLRDRLGV